MVRQKLAGRNQQLSDLNCSRILFPEDRNIGRAITEHLMNNDAEQKTIQQMPKFLRIGALQDTGPTGLSRDNPEIFSIPEQVTVNNVTYKLRAVNKFVNNDHFYSIVNDPEQGLLVVNDLPGHRYISANETQDFVQKPPKEYASFKRDEANPGQFKVAFAKIVLML